MRNRYLITAIIALISFTGMSAQLSKARRPYADLIITPDKADWNYKSGETPSIEVSLLQNGVAINDVEVTIEAGQELLTLSQKETKRTKNGIAKFTLKGLKNPGFIQCKVTASYDDKNTVSNNKRKYSDQVKLAFDPEKILPTVKMPSDFDSFWKKSVEELADVPLELDMKYNSEYSTDKVDVFATSFRVDKKGHRMGGWLMIPKAEGKYPAIFSPPGAGVKKQTPSTDLAASGVIVFQTEIHGLSLDMSVEQYALASKAFGEYMFFNMDDKDQFYYKHVYLGCKRAIDAIYTLDKFNGEVATTGGSQGGALAVVTAVLDNRIKAVATFYPAICDVTGYLHGRAGGWPHYFSKSNIDRCNTPDKVNTVLYYDIVNFSKSLKVPVFFSFGYNDNTCPPTSLFAAYNSIKAPKQLIVNQITGHWRYPETNDTAMKWLKQQLNQ